MADEKNVLQEGQSIALSINAGGKEPEVYEIGKVIGQGGSAVCYEAKRRRGSIVETGLLKEYNPIWYVEKDKTVHYMTVRLKSGQLVPKEKYCDDFVCACNEYVSAYKCLGDIIDENTGNNLLKNYIQLGEILYGCPELEVVYDSVANTFAVKGEHKDTPRSVYVWSTGVMGEGFDKYVENVRSTPEINSDKRFSNILTVVTTLTDCVRIMHNVKLMHLDIKPSNFLVPYDGNLEINPHRVSMFDVNTIYRYSEDSKAKVVGTDGFCAPEVITGNACLHSDIYSIGATLFNALVIVKYVTDGLYRDRYYEHLDAMLQHSKLVKGLRVYDDIRIRSTLANIMKKCLAKDVPDRYESIEVLYKDLKALLDYVNRVNVLEKEKRLNTKGINDPGIVMQKMLYKYPLYDTLKDGEKQIDVLVAGTGNYGQKFVDICLQVCQMKDYAVTIDAVSDTYERGREEYLQFRPAISRFVNINGEMEEADKAYGRLNFKPLVQGKDEKFSDNEKENVRILNEITANAKKAGQRYSYVFVALGDDKLNESVAKILYEMTNSKVDTCTVCYVCENGGGKGDNAEERLHCIDINEPVTPETIDPRLEQMAFNTYLLWNNTVNLNVADQRVKFRESKYDYSSSLAFALSIKYKLYSIGVPMENYKNNDEVDYVKWAEAFDKKIIKKSANDAVAQENFDWMVALEHRRWVLDRAEDGWRPPVDSDGNLDLKGCVEAGKVRNEENMTHPCMVFCTHKMPLFAEEYNKDNKKKWDNPSIDDTLDELDYMSVKLHQLFGDKAKGVKMPLEVDIVGNIVANADREVVHAFNQFRFCLKNILNGVESYTRMYEHYVARFVNAAKKSMSDKVQDIEAHLAIIKRAFVPVIEANLYRNYKENDRNFIHKIPFILSYNFRPKIAMAFDDGKDFNGRSESVFRNVASATVLSPQVIYYLYNFTERSTVELLKDKIQAVLNYLDKREIKTEIVFKIAVMGGFSQETEIALKKNLEKLKEESKYKCARLIGYDTAVAESCEEVCDAFVQQLKDENVELYDCSTGLFESNLDNRHFENCVIEAMPYFEFKWQKKEFKTSKGCEYLKFIEDKSFLRINDMFRLMNAVDNRDNLPEYTDDYEKLWTLYTGEYLPDGGFEKGAEVWSKLCRMLKEYENARPKLAVIDAKAVFENNDNSYEYYLPEFTFDTVKGLISELANKGVVGEGSTVERYTSDTCLVAVFTSENKGKILEKLFAEPGLLLPYYSVSVHKNMDTEEVWIDCNSTKVTQVQSTDDQVRLLLEELEKLDYIKYLEVACGSESGEVKYVSFVYSSPRIKTLLTNENAMLKIHAYYQVLRTGYFDDVACGYEFKWAGDKARNEFDLVLTKGFASVLVTCRTAPKMSEADYDQMISLSSQFGVGAKKVIVASLYDSCQMSAMRDNESLAEKNKGILTITDEDAIRDIGETLKGII